jgi:hypothetical protein
VSQVPWWGLPLIAAAFALAGAAAAQFVTARNDRMLRRGRRTRRWYAERKAAYVELLAVFERDTYRLRSAYDAGEKPSPALAYVDEVGPALMQVRLLASGPVRSAALAVHLLLQKLHGQMNPTSVPGVRPEIHFREMVGIEVDPPDRPATGEKEVRFRARQLLRREPRDETAATG